MASNDWERHKSTILYLYLLEERKLEDVVDHMKEYYSFDKQKYQYEYQLRRKWKVKKNATAEVWRNILHQMRKRGGRETEVSIFGVQIPPDKIRKEIRRHGRIPTAQEFGMNPPSPTLPEHQIVRVVTPEPVKMQLIWPDTLPWLQFRNSAMLDIPRPSRFLERLSTASDSLSAWFRRLNIGDPSTTMTSATNPQNVYERIVNLASSVPNLRTENHPMTQDIPRVGNLSSIATELLKLMFFSLSNNLNGYAGYSDGRAYDQLVLHLVDTISESIPELMAHLLTCRCPTTDSIKECVFKSAVRQGRKQILSQLLKAGVDVDTAILFFWNADIELHRGKVDLVLKAGAHNLHYRAIEIAAIRCDLDLSITLLAAVDTMRPDDVWTLCFIAMSKEHNRALDFAQHLIEKGVSVDGDSKGASPLAFAIAVGNNRLVMLLLEKGASTRINVLGYRHGHPVSEYLLETLEVRMTPLHVAVISKNAEMLGRLLGPILTQEPPCSEHDIQELLLVACLTGDIHTAEKLLDLNVFWDEEWQLEMTPLAATAWNDDMRIAERLLKSRSLLDMELRRTSTQVTTTPRAIHIAAYYGNIYLIQQLLDRHVNCNALYLCDTSIAYYAFYGILPLPLGDIEHVESVRYWSPFQLALRNGEATAAALICPLAELRGGELALAMCLGDQSLVSTITIRGGNILSRNPLGQTALWPAVDAGNINVISTYLASGGEWSSAAFLEAVERALKSGNVSIVEAMSKCRFMGVIDRFEAGALCKAVSERNWPIVRLLLQRPFLAGPARSHDHWTGGPLNSAFYSGDSSIIDALLVGGYKPQWMNLRALIGHYPKIYPTTTQLLFWSQLAPSIEDLEHRRQLLLLAIRWNDAHKARECISSIGTCNFYIKCDLGTTRLTPLQYTIRDGSDEIVYLLHNAGADVNAAADIDGGATALQHAAIYGRFKMALFLLNQGADVNAPSAKLHGRTALEAAAEHGRLDMVQLFMKYDADINGSMRIHFVRSVKLARNEGHFALAKHLKGLGAWTDRDQELYDRPNILDDEGYFVFDEEEEDWHFREVFWDSSDDEWYSVRSASSSADDYERSNVEYEQDTDAGDKEPTSSSSDDSRIPISEELIEGVDLMSPPHIDVDVWQEGLTGPVELLPGCPMNSGFVVELDCHNDGIVVGNSDPRPDLRMMIGEDAFLGAEVVEDLWDI